MNKNKLTIILSGLLLFSCGSKPSTSQEISTSSQEAITTSITSSISSETLKSTTSSENITSSSSVTSSNVISSSSFSSEKEDVALSEDSFLIALEEAKEKDNDYSSVSILNYTFKKNSYSRRKYEMKAYSNNVTIHQGEVRANNNANISNFVEQRVYQDNTYSAIRKFDSTFLNRANKETMTLENANELLSINQSNIASLAIYTFKNGYKLNYQGYITSDNTKCVSYSYIDDYVDNSGYVLCALIQIELTSDNHLSDLFYSEAYYDSYYVDEGIDALRKHGAHPIDDGYTYEMTSFVKEQRTEYQGALVFPLEDNFINNMSFVNQELTISLSSIKADEYNRKSLNLLDYLSCSPAISLTGKVGCPINNLTFISSNLAVGVIGDSYYLDINSIGETLINAHDAGNNIDSTNSLKIVITE